MVRFSKFDLVLKAESKVYKFWRAINVCEFVKIAKFANINRARTFVDLQYIIGFADKQSKTGSCEYVFLGSDLQKL